MVLNIFLQMDYKIVQYLYQLEVFIRLVKIVVTIISNRGILQKHKKKTIKNLRTSDISFAPQGIAGYEFRKVELKGICLK